MTDAAQPSTGRDRKGPAPKIDTSVPHPARRYNYWLGGKDNFAADRASGDRIAQVMPTVRVAVRENRRFQTRAVKFLAGEAGISQFLDIGTGIPAMDNPHEVAQAIDPTCRVAYVDNDPVVLAHSRALLTSSAEGATAYVEADVRAPEKILNDPDVLATVDFSKPVALLMVALLHFIPEEEAYDVVSTLRDALPSGSYLAISHGTQDYLTPEQLEMATAESASGRHGGIWPRARDQFARFFDGLELVPPGIQPVAEWRADGETQPRPAAKDIAIYGAVARLP